MTHVVIALAITAVIYVSFGAGLSFWLGLVDRGDAEQSTDEQCDVILKMSVGWPKTLWDMRGQR